MFNIEVLDWNDDLNVTNTWSYRCYCCIWR